MIISTFRKENNNEKPLLKAAFINGDIFVGNDQLKALTQIKTKNELIGEVIGLLQSPIQRVLGALQNKDAAKEAVAEVFAKPIVEVAEVVEVVEVAEVAEVVEVAPVAEAPAVETPVVKEATPEEPAAEEPQA